jgi:hypothetical protein
MRIATYSVVSAGSTTRVPLSTHLRGIGHHQPPEGSSTAVEAGKQRGSSISAANEGGDLASDRPGRDVVRRGLYVHVLGWAFAIFNATRTASYFPTLWAIYASGESSQHSLFTWITWLGANVTMAAWLYENNGRRFNAAIAVNIGNAVMCLVTTILIVTFRL